MLLDAYSVALSFPRGMPRRSKHLPSNAKEIWEAGENVDLRSQAMFSHLQVLTACLSHSILNPTLTIDGDTGSVSSVDSFFSEQLILSLVFSSTDAS